MATKVVSSTPMAITGYMATFYVDTDLVAPYRYSWKKDGAYIPGAPSAKTYTTPPLQQEDLRSQFSVTVHGQDKVEESDMVAINPDIPDPVTVANQGLPKPAWQPYVDPTTTTTPATPAPDTTKTTKGKS